MTGPQRGSLPRRQGEQRLLELGTFPRSNELSLDGHVTDRGAWLDRSPSVSELFTRRVWFATSRVEKEVVMQIGDPDGFGRYDRLSVVDDGEGLVCHECGQTHRALGTHAWRAHALPADQYRTRHGLPPATSLLAPATRHRPARTRSSAFAPHPTA